MKKRRLIYGVLGIILSLFLYVQVINPNSSNPRATAKNARKMLSEQLRKDYGEDFMIYGLGKRTAGKESFYQTKIVPLSKIGTGEEEDHTVEAYVDIKKGRLVSSGDSYHMLGFNRDKEEYFQKILEEKLGKYVRAETRVEYHFIDKFGKKRTTYNLDKTFESSFKILLGEKEPKFVMYQAIYIFDKKLTPKLKEEYREKIWSYVEWLKEKGMYEYTMLEINFVDERILSNNFEESEKLMFKDLGEKKKDFYGDKIKYPTNFSRKIFVKEIIKGYKETKEEEKLINLHRFKMKERDKFIKEGNFRDYYSNTKTSIISKENPRGYVEIFGTAINKKEIIYWENDISVFKKGGKNE